MKLTNQLRATANKTSNIMTKELLRQAADKIEQLENENEWMRNKYNSEVGLRS